MEGSNNDTKKHPAIDYNPHQVFSVGCSCSCFPFHSHFPWIYLPLMSCIFYSLLLKLLVDCTIYHLSILHYWGTCMGLWKQIFYTHPIPWTLKIITLLSKITATWSYFHLQGGTCYILTKFRTNSFYQWIVKVDLWYLEKCSMNGMCLPIMDLLLLNCILKYMWLTQWLFITFRKGYAHA